MLLNTEELLDQPDSSIELEEFRKIFRELRIIFQETPPKYLNCFPYQ